MYVAFKSICPVDTAAGLTLTAHSTVLCILVAATSIRFSFCRPLMGFHALAGACRVSLQISANMILYMSAVMVCLASYMQSYTCGVPGTQTHADHSLPTQVQTQHVKLRAFPLMKSAEVGHHPRALLLGAKVSLFMPFSLGFWPSLLRCMLVALSCCAAVAVAAAGAMAHVGRHSLLVWVTGATSWASMCLGFRLQPRVLNQAPVSRL